MKVQIPFIGASAQSRDSTVNDQKTVNLYPEVTNSGDHPVILYSVHGLNNQFAKGAGPTRSNGVVFNGKGYFVSGSELIQIDTSNASASVGVLNSNSGRVSMVSGANNYLALVDGTDGYTYDGTTFAQITDPDFPSNATHIDYMDKRYVAINSETGDFYASDQDNPTSWTALGFATASGNQDNNKAVIATDDLLYILGEYSTEPFHNTANVDFTFEPLPGGFIDYGIAAPYSAVKAINSLIFLGQSESGGVVVLRLSGAQYQVISTPEITWQINNLTYSDAFGFFYEDGIHQFYVLTFPTSNKTFVADLSMPPELMWTERTSYTGTEYVRWRPAGHLFFNNNHYFGDYVNGNFYTADYTIYKDNDELIERVRRGRYIHNKGKSKQNISYGSVEIEFAPGVGLVTGQGSDPQAMYRYSDTGGKLWSNELWADIGINGNYLQRAVWTKLGSSYDRIHEVRITDPVNVVITGMFANIKFNEL